MDRLLPDCASEALDELYLDLDVPAGRERPYVVLGMVTSVDGAVAVAGRTADLGGPADALAYSRLREVCDVILVGAATAREENYGPPRTRPGGAQRRRARGLAERAVLAVVTASGRLDPQARLFADPTRRPVVVAPRAARGGPLHDLGDRAEILEAGDDSVDFADMLARFAARGWRRVLCEGGPTINSLLLAEGLVDELFVTFAPVLVGGAAAGIAGVEPGGPHRLELMELRHHASELVARYQVS